MKLPVRGALSKVPQTQWGEPSGPPPSYTHEVVERAALLVMVPLEPLELLVTEPEVDLAEPERI